MKIEAKEHEQLSHSTIYRRIEVDRQQGGLLFRKLPRFGKTRWKGGKRNKKAGVRLIPNRVDIAERPKVADDRVRLGDWEGDTVHGQNAHLVTLVDRTSLFTLVGRVLKKTKGQVADAMIRGKGGIEKLMSPEESAAKEAFEEAGVIGDVSNELFAEYAYNKRGRKFHVKVYSLEVSSILVQWDEMKKRKRCCVEVGVAKGLIKKKQKKVLRKFQEMLCTIY